MATNRTIQELLDQMEIPENGRSTSPTSQFGSTSRKKGTNPHGGLDMNRGHAVGGSVSSPVYGIIGSEIGGKLGKIVIHEVDPVTGELTGFDIDVLHTQAQSVQPTDKVEPRQTIGTEGGVGAGGVSHAHFQVFKGTDPTPLNPLRHIYEYHHPGQPLPALPQFEPQSVPAIHPPRRAPADDPIFQTPGRPPVEQTIAPGNQGASSNAPNISTPRSSPRPPRGNASPELTPQPNRSTNLPRSPGPPLDIKTPAQSGPQGSVAPAPMPAPILPPLYLGPEPPRRFGPFVVPQGPVSGSSVGIDLTNSPQLRSGPPSWATPSYPTSAANGGPNVENGLAISPSPQAFPTFNDRFGTWVPSSPSAAAPNPDQLAPSATSKPMRYLGSRVAGRPVTPFDIGAPPAPFDGSNNQLAPVPPVSFGDRMPSPPIVPSDPEQPQSNGAAQTTPDKIRILNGRLVVPNGAGVTAFAPGLSTAAQNDWPPAPADRRPVPEYQMPPPPSVYGLPDRDADNMDDWFDRWIKPLFNR